MRLFLNNSPPFPAMRPLEPAVQRIKPLGAVPSRLVGLLLLPILCIALAARSDGPGDNHPENVRRMPKPGIELTHLIGPKAGHAYEPATRDEVERRMTAIIRRGRNRPIWPAAGFPGSFTTYTLRYNRGPGVTIDALEQHWEQARISATADGLSTTNVAAFAIDLPSGSVEPLAERPAAVTIDGTALPLPERMASDRSLQASFHKVDGVWRSGPLPSAGLRKRHGLQGPIDDAFMDAFLFVRPTGKGRHAAPDAWARAELERAIEHWRRHFRGRVRVKDDVSVTEADMAAAHVVLWGDDLSNAVWKRLAADLPIRWQGNSLVVGSAEAARSFDAASHAPIMIYPNPLAPDRYVVTNSSFTFREYAYLNNARQVPMLPDWAIIDVRQKPDTVRPGRIAAADFFGERWEVRPPRDE